MPAKFGGDACATYDGDTKGQSCCPAGFTCVTTGAARPANPAGQMFTIGHDHMEEEAFFGLCLGPPGAFKRP